ncbi:hypothetical protein [Streptomyces sp. NPDC060031]
MVVLGTTADGWGPVEPVWTLVIAARWPLLVERLRPHPAAPAQPSS